MTLKQSDGDDNNNDNGPNDKDAELLMLLLMMVEKIVNNGVPDNGHLNNIQCWDFIVFRRTTTAKVNKRLFIRSY